MTAKNEEKEEVKDAEIVEATPEVVQPQQIQEQQSQSPSTVDGFISQAIAQGASLETMERLFKLSEDMKASKAKEAYTRAMAQLQGVLPIVKARKKNGGTDSTYAPLEDIIAQCKKAISDNDFSYSWDTVTTEKKIIVTCSVTHIEGHTQTSKMESDISEGTRANSAPQKAAITITYLKRYTLTNLFGIAIADEDQDARLGVEAKVATPADPKAKIVALLKALGIVSKTPEETKLKIMDLTQMEATEANYEEIISRLGILLEEHNEA